jgi:polyisoprenoid-binding protein YceI
VTGNGRRDRDMWKSLEVERFPTIRFDLDAVAPGATQGDSVAVTLRGRFTIHGVTRESAVRGWVHVESSRVRFRGYTPLQLTDYTISGLSKAFGLLKMDPDVVVRMELLFEG